MRPINGPGIPAAGLRKSSGKESINNVNTTYDKVNTPMGVMVPVGLLYIRLELPPRGGKYLSSLCAPVAQGIEHRIPNLFLAYISSHVTS